MRFKLLRRRLTITSPRMAVRNAMPWPLRWASAAIVLGFCGAIALWAFEFGKDIAGLDGGSREEIARLRGEIAHLRDEREKTQSFLNTSASLVTAEKAAQERLAQQIKTLEQENRALKDDLGFFEKLIPSTGAEGVAIRGLQADVVAGTQLKWQVLVLQPEKNAPEFKGRLEVTVAGTHSGKPWSMALPTGPVPLQFRQYRRMEGLVDLPAQALVKTVSVKVLEGSATKAAQSINL